MANGKLEFAGEFEILEAWIIASGERLNIESSIMGLTLFEDMDLPFLHGELSMYNTLSFADKLPLIGEERLELSLKTPEITDAKIEFLGEQSFWIYQCVNRQHQGTLQTFTLKFCSPELALNNNTTFSESIQGTDSEIISKILNKHIPNTKKIEIEPTKDKKNLVFSRKHPFEAINQIKSNSTSKQKQPGYYFFENLYGYQFVNIERLEKGKVVWDYSIQGEGAATVIGKGLPTIELELHSIIMHKFNHPDRRTDLMTGVLGSKLIVHDIFNKQYRTKDYSYESNFSKEKHIGNAEVIPFAPPITGLKSDNSKSKIYYQPVSIKGGGGRGNNGLFTGSHKSPVSVDDIKLQQKNSQRNQIEESFNLEATVHGITGMTIGQLVDIKIPRPTEQQHNMDVFDTFYQGNFLIKRIQHQFLRSAMSHTMIMTLVKDSISKGS